MEVSIILRRCVTKTGNNISFLCSAVYQGFWLISADERSIIVDVDMNGYFLMGRMVRRMARRMVSHGHGVIFASSSIYISATDHFMRCSGIMQSLGTQCQQKVYLFLPNFLRAEGGI